MNRKKFWVLVTVGALGLTYAVVASNAFADSAVVPTPTVTAPTAPATSDTAATISGIPAPSGISTLSGIQIPSGLTSPGTVPSIGNDDDADDQVGEQSNDASQNGISEDGGVVNDNSGALTDSNDNSDDVNQSGDNQDGSSNND